MNDGTKRPRDDNEGEGKRTADARYPKGATDFATRMSPVHEAIEAERDVENYRDEYERVDEAGRSRSAGDLEADREGRD